MKPVLLNPNAQTEFVGNDFRHSAFMGGRGAGKTVANVVRGLLYAHQPNVPGQLPPTGCILADSYPHLRDIVYPAMYLVLEMAGMRQGKDWKEVKNQADRKFVLKNGAELKMRSLDEPNRVRGLNLSWFGIDEGRMFNTDEPYKVLLACLRQGTHPDKDIDEAGTWVPGENYKHAGWVTSTPNGYDWMWKRFHPDSPNRKPNTSWFNAPTYQNSKHLPASFLRDLEADYDGLFYQQEVMGEFVGAVGGAVWPMYVPKLHTAPLAYDPELPLLAGWDFGIGDAGVCLFAQVAWAEKKLYDNSTVEIPQLRLLDSIEMTDKTVSDWANTFWRWLDRNTGGRVPNSMWGDPAGMQRNSVTGTSTITALGEHGIYVRPTRKGPVDESIIIIANLMERPGSFLIDESKIRLQMAVQTHRWRIDDEGNRLSSTPVHDWTSHTCDALRYLALGAIGLHPRRHAAPANEPQPGTFGYMLNQLEGEHNQEVSMNSDKPAKLRWSEFEEVGLDGLLD